MSETECHLHVSHDSAPAEVREHRRTLRGSTWPAASSGLCAWRNLQLGVGTAGYGSHWKHPRSGKQMSTVSERDDDARLCKLAHCASAIAPRLAWWQMCPAR